MQHSSNSYEIRGINNHKRKIEIGPLYISVKLAMHVCVVGEVIRKFHTAMLIVP